MSVNDQYNMGRIPLRPLALKDRALAQTKELLIDNIGDHPTYHIYIVDTKDRTKVIDLTALSAQNVDINGDNIKISIDGLLDAQNLKYISSDFDIYDKIVEVKKLNLGLIKYLSNKG